jgi:hypothetical protein
MQIYDEYCPVLLNQFKSREYNEFATFDAALDEFYSKIESQKVNQQQKAKEEIKLDQVSHLTFNAHMQFSYCIPHYFFSHWKLLLLVWCNGAYIRRCDSPFLCSAMQENRVHTLRKEVDHCVKMAELIEYNLEDVDAAILAVRVSLANEMSWEALTRMIKEERKAGNPVAGLIDKLNFERNCITLLLSNNLDDMDEDEKTAPVEKVCYTEHRFLPWSSMETYSICQPYGIVLALSSLWFFGSDVPGKRFSHVLCILCVTICVYFPYYILLWRVRTYFFTFLF